MKRSGKFYRKNEAEVMKLLGLNPTINSGSGWIEKEDGQNENVICQLKSTDAQSIKLNKKDFDTLSYNASNAHKLPVFAIQFLQSNEVYLIVKPDLLTDVAKYIKEEKYDRNLNDFIGIDLSNHKEVKVDKKINIKSSENAREKFKMENDKKFKKERRSAR